MNKLSLPKSIAACLFLLGFSLHGQSSPAPDPSRGLRFCKIKQISSSIAPNMNASLYGIDRLTDGELPQNGYPSRWTKWYQVDPVLTLDCGEERRVGAIRIFFQAMSRDDELKSVRVEVSLDGKSFFDFNEYVDIVTPRERGAWVELDLQAVRARYFRLSPRFQGWGHQWGEVELWELAD